MGLPETDAGTVDALACELARITLEHDPASATALGLHDRDDELPAPTRDSLAAHETDLRALRERVDALAAPDVDADVDRRGLLALVDAELAAFELHRPWERNPLVWAMGGVQALFLPMARTHLPAAQRRDAVLGRCRAIPAYLDAARALLEPDRVPPEWVPMGAASAAAGADFCRDAVRQAHPEAADVAAAAADALASFGAWLTDELAPQAGGTYAVGEGAAARLLRDVHLLDETPAQVAARGRELLDRCEAALVDAAGTADWRSALGEARADHPDEGELIDAYRRELSRLERFCFDEDLVSDPGAEAVLEPTPPFMRQMMGYAAYLPPGPFDDVLSGQLWVTPPPDPSGLTDHAYAAIPAITAHEGYPGHHLQLTTVSALPAVTRKLRGGTSLMVEGWGLYVEELMHETGYYTAAARLVQLALTAWRAARIVIDMGLHAGVMTVDEAVDLLGDRAGISRTTAQVEVARYTMTPTQPFSYLYGAEEIRRIRAAWRARTGGGLREFHDALLAYGHLPPALVAEALVPSADG